MASRRRWRAFKVSLWVMGAAGLFGGILLKFSSVPNNSLAIVIIIAVSLAIGLLIFVSTVR